ncbi:uncharacterized protein LOC131000399 [Salvia miltiorrhiza]|uniref:uncharacterized protein LOC131000399 n=1 Tax=Salvia miltiorrhiza TaxID=226208 RepID=UPI0025AB5E64|nr:uncharacterized protein LOC131000399 [Salvia miltiorrhiza]
MKYSSGYCVTHPALEGRFEVEKHEDRFVVDIVSRSCTCRLWDITGIPCAHACSAIYFLEDNAENYVHEYFFLERYKLLYEFGFPPLNGEKMWPRAEGYDVKPPQRKKMPGRPKKRRIRDPSEPNPSNPNKLRRNGSRMTCQKCFQQGHNSRGCKNTPVDKPPKKKGERGRPRKTQAPQQIVEPSTSNARSTSKGNEAAHQTLV